MNELRNTPADKDYKPSEIVNNLAEGQIKAVQLLDGTYITEKLAKSMTKAEQRALEAYPRDKDSELNYRRANYRIAYERGYNQAEKDILTRIRTRLSEIIGDAQPRPALRAELEELITKIKKQ